MAQKKYKNAPIIEAIIEIQYKVEKAISIDNFNSFYEKIKDNYPDREKQIITEFKIQAKDKKELFFEPRKIEDNAFRYKHKNGTQILTSEKERLSLSKLKPYESWQVFISEFKNIWHLHKEIFNANEIQKISVRFINNFQCPINELNNFLKIRPIMAPGKYQLAISNVSQRFTVVNAALNAQGIINTIITPKEDKNVKILDIVFDIDVYKLLKIDNKWSLLNNELSDLKNFKNDIFETNITDKTREMFQ